jgi:hypothetical protein
MSNRLKIVVLSLVASATWAATPAPNVYRGVVTAIDAGQVTVKGDEGKSRSFALLKDWTVTVLKPVDVAAIQPGSFIGTAEIPQADGTGRSLEVHVFPPGVKAGEGHYDWDLQKGSKMTNGTVGTVVAGANGRELEVSYPTGKRRITVPKNVPIVEMTPGQQSQVKVGTPVFLLLVNQPDGSVGARGASIGVNGARPPM